MQISNSVKHKQGVISTLSTLYQRHFSAAQQYGQLHDLAKEGSPVATLIESLAGYHRQLSQSTATLLTDFPQSPAKPNRDMLPGSEHLQEVDPDQQPAAYKVFYEHESDLRGVYSRLLDNKELPKPVKDQLTGQHKQVTKVVDKLDRIIKTGEDPIMQV